MELSNLIMTAIWSLIVGMSSAVLLNAKPVKYILGLFNADSLEIFNCALCFGFWFSWAVLITSGIPFLPSWVFALFAAYWAEQTDRKINFN